MASPPSSKRGGPSLMELRYAAEEKEHAEVERAFADLEYWSSVWATQHPPFFDKLCASPFVGALASTWGLGEKARCLIPGCGRGYNVSALAATRPTFYVLGVDLCPVAVRLAEERQLAEFAFAEKLEIDPPFPLQAAEYRLGNFFKLPAAHPENRFDLVLDDSFLCMLDPRVRPGWAKKMAALVKVGGQLVVAIYPIMDRDPKAGGPPFALSIAGVRDLLIEEGFKPLAIDVLPPELCHAATATALGAEDSSPNAPRTALGRFVRLHDEEEAM